MAEHNTLTALAGTRPRASQSSTVASNSVTITLTPATGARIVLKSVGWSGVATATTMTLQVSSAAVVVADLGISDAAAGYAECNIVSLDGETIVVVLAATTMTTGIVHVTYEEGAA